MKKLMWLALVAVVTGGMFLSSCKAAGADSGTKSDKTVKKAKGDSQGGALKAGTITFKYIPEEGDEPESVYLAGDINGWNPSDPNYMMEQGKDGSFSVDIELDPGTYKYKYVIDGEWTQSMEDIADQIKPTPSSYVDDGFGGKNAVIEVEE